MDNCLKKAKKITGNSNKELELPLHGHTHHERHEGGERGVIDLKKEHKHIID